MTFEIPTITVVILAVAWVLRGVLVAYVVTRARRGVVVEPARPAQPVGSSRPATGAR